MKYTDKQQSKQTEIYLRNFAENINKNKPVYLAQELARESILEYLERLEKEVKK